MPSPFTPPIIPGAQGYPLVLTGATNATRYVGGNTSGAPASGTFAVGDFTVNGDGSVYVCTVAGSPGTWVNLTASSSAGTDGWVNATTETWTFASSTTFTIAGVDKTSIYTRNTKIKLTQSATVKYFVVTGSTFSTDTTVTITGGTSYTFTNNAVTQNYYSTAASPLGYPQSFAFTPTFTGFSANPSAFSCAFQVVGDLVMFLYASGTAGTSNATTFTMTLPIAPSLGERYLCRVQDSGTQQTGPGMGTTSGGSTTLSLFKTTQSGAFTGSGAKDCDISFVYIMN